MLLKITSTICWKLFHPDRKRALLGFVGRFPKSLFGVSTEQDTNILLKHIEQVQQLTAVDHDQLGLLTENLQSYIIKSDKTAQLLQKAIQLNHQAFNLTETLVSKKINEALNEVLNWINILHTYGSQYVDILVDTLQDISDILPTLGSFQISHREIGYYYHLNDVTYQRVDDNLYVKIKIPLTTTTTLFTLYRMNAVPIPLGADRKERSIVEMSKPYIAISHDNLFYIMLSESEYHFCTGNQLKRCNQALSMQETTHPDCALALFNEQPKLVSKLCQINLLLANTSATHIITVSDNSYLQ